MPVARCTGVAWVPETCMHGCKMQLLALEPTLLGFQIKRWLCWPQMGTLHDASLPHNNLIEVRSPGVLEHRQRM